MRSAASRSPSSHSCQLFSTVKVAAGDADGCFPLSLQAKVMKHYDAFGQTTSIYIYILRIGNATTLRPNLVAAAMIC